MTGINTISRRGFVAAGALAAASLFGCASNPSAPQGIDDDLASRVVQPVFDLGSGFVTLSNGIPMPLVGIGTYDLSQAEAEESVYWAIEAGARLIDTAAAYNNEEGVGRGIARAISDGLATRDDLFVTTKLWQDGYSRQGVETGLSKLGLDYVDLLFVHQAMGDYQEGYQVVLDAQADGLTRCVGLSNFTDEQFADTVAQMGVIPQVAQYECHLHLQRHAAQGFLAQYGTQLEGWFPLGGRGNTQTYLADETVVDIAERHGYSPAQVIERWHLQEGHVIMPGSHNADHIRENIATLDLSLDDDDMSRLRALDINSAYFGMVGGMSQQTLDNHGDFVFEG